MNRAGGGGDVKDDGAQRDGGDKRPKGISRGLCLLYTASLDKRRAVSYPYSFLFANPTWMFFPPGVPYSTAYTPPTLYLNLGTEQRIFSQWRKATLYFDAMKTEF